MSRLPYLQRDQLGDEGQLVWDSIVDTRGDRVIGDNGALTGPFNAFLHTPTVGQHLSALGAALRFYGTLDPVLRELAICTVAGQWKAEFEWHAHARLAREQGVAGAVIDAIRKGEEPEFDSGDQRTVYTVARQLIRTGRVTPETYDAAHRLLGDTALVELVSLCGYYCLMSFILNTFDVPLPPGADPAWKDTGS